MADKNVDETYKRFRKKFKDLCFDFVGEDFSLSQLNKICSEVIDEFNT